MSRIIGYVRSLSLVVPFEAFTRDIWLICISNIIGAFGEGLYFWVFPLYIKTLQADYVQLGIVFSALYGASALVLIPGGLLADRFDRKKILILSWTPWALSPLIYSFAQSWQHLIPGAICWGVSMLGVPAANSYIIYSVVDKRKLSSVLAFVWSCYSFSYIFAPTAGSYLATIVGMQWVLRLASMVTGVSTAIFLLLHSQHPKKNNTKARTPSPLTAKAKGSWRIMLLWSGLFAAATFFMSTTRPYVPTFLAEHAGLNEVYVGLFGSFSYAGMTFLGIAMGRLGDRWRKSGAMSICLLFYIASVVPMLLTQNIAILMFLAFIMGGSLVAGSLVSSYVGTIAPENKQGLWVSIPQTSSLLAAFAASYLGGYLYTQSAHNAFIVSASAIPFLVLLVLVMLRE